MLLFYLPPAFIDANTVPTINLNINKGLNSKIDHDERTKRLEEILSIVTAHSDK